jgi:uncharacterized protein YodC (DUF2158 family)
METKFKVGDVVKVIEAGSGMGLSDVGKTTTITVVGTYCAKIGYKVYPEMGNSKTGQYRGFIGENSFELAEEKKPSPIPPPIGKVYYSKPMTTEEMTWEVIVPKYNRRLLLLL